MSGLVLIAVLVYVFGRKRTGSGALPGLGLHALFKAAASIAGVVATVVVLGSGPASGGGAALVLALICVVYINMGRLLRLTTVRWGWPRATYALAKLGGVGWQVNDVPGSAWMMAMLARFRLRTASSATTEAVDAWLVRGPARAPTGLPGFLAFRGLHAAHLGRPDEARALLSAVAFMAQPRTSRYVRNVAREWLAADALAAGQSDRAARYAGPIGAFPRGVRVQLLAHVADARNGRGRNVSRGLACAAYFVAGGRELLCVVEGARQAWTRRADAGQATVTAAPTIGDADAKGPGDLVARHAAALAAPAATRPEDVLALAARWEALLASPAFMAYLSKSILRNASPVSSAAVCGQIEHDAVTDLTYLVDCTGAVFAAGKASSRLLDDALRSARTVAVERLRQHVHDARVRVKAGMAFSPMGEARAVGQAIRLFDDARCLDVPQASLFRIVHVDACAHAVALSTMSRLSRVVAHAEFQWLLEQALVAGDAEAMALEARNCSATV